MKYLLKQELKNRIPLLKTLYSQKKQFLLEFLKVTQEGNHLFSQGLFDSVDEYYFKRDKIIEILEFLNKKIDKLNLEKTPYSTLFSNSNDLKVLIDEISQITQEILEADLMALNHLDRFKNSIESQIQKLKTSKKVVSSYKSITDHHRLDEKI